MTVCACDEGPGVRGYYPIWSTVDNQGNQADDTFFLWVLDNNVPYQPVTIWQNAAMTIPWTDPIQYRANGTLPNNMFWDPTRFYRLEIRKNNGLAPPSQNDELIELIDNYNPTFGGGGNSPTSGAQFTINQITNPQFSLINFVTPLVLTAVSNPAPIEVAPGWFLDGLTGTGTVTIAREPLNDTLANPTNAPYALNINISGGFTGVPYLRQRFQQNGMLWANKWVSCSLTARVGATPVAIKGRIDASDGAPQAFVLQTPMIGTTFQEYKGTGVMPAPTNPNTPPDAYVDFKILLTNDINIYISSVQLIVSDADTQYEYQQDTINRQIDHTFNVYKPQLFDKQIPSYLVGWDFPLNPAQRRGETLLVGAFGIGANKSQYVWDQTIVFQSVNSSCQITRAASGAMRLTAGAAGQFAVIQYLGPEQARQILNDRAAVHLALSTNQANGYSGTVSLWYTKVALPTVAAGTNNSLVSALDADGFPTCGNGTWFEVPRNINQDATFEVTAPTSGFQDFDFNSWDLLSSANAADANLATFFAIVIGFEQIAQNDYIDFWSVGLASGDIATRPAPLTYADTLLGCQEFFYSSFPAGTLPQQNFGASSGTLQWTLVSAARATFFNMPFPTTMRANPLITIYNPGNANAFFWDLDSGGGQSTTAAATQVNASAKTLSIGCPQANLAPGAAAGNRIQAHVTADAGFGIV